APLHAARRRRPTGTRPRRPASDRAPPPSRTTPRAAPPPGAPPRPPPATPRERRSLARPAPLYLLVRRATVRLRIVRATTWLQDTREGSPNAAPRPHGRRVRRPIRALVRHLLAAAARADRVPRHGG